MPATGAAPCRPVSACRPRGHDRCLEESAHAHSPSSPSFSPDWPDAPPSLRPPPSTTCARPRTSPRTASRALAPQAPRCADSRAWRGRPRVPRSTSVRGPSSWHPARRSDLRRRQLRRRRGIARAAGLDASGRAACSPRAVPSTSGPPARSRCGAMGGNISRIVAGDASTGITLDSGSGDIIVDGLLDRRAHRLRPVRRRHHAVGDATSRSRATSTSGAASTTRRDRSRSAGRTAAASWRRRARGPRHRRTDRRGHRDGRRRHISCEGLLDLHRRRRRQSGGDGGTLDISAWMAASSSAASSGSNGTSGTSDFGGCGGGSTSTRAVAITLDRLIDISVRPPATAALRPSARDVDLVQNGTILCSAQGARGDGGRWSRCGPRPHPGQHQPARRRSAASGKTTCDAEALCDVRLATGRTIDTRGPRGDNTLVSGARPITIDGRHARRPPTRSSSGTTPPVTREVRSIRRRRPGRCPQLRPAAAAPPRPRLRRRRACERHRGSATTATPSTATAATRTARSPPAATASRPAQRSMRRRQHRRRRRLRRRTAPLDVAAATASRPCGEECDEGSRTARPATCSADCTRIRRRAAATARTDAGRAVRRRQPTTTLRRLLDACLRPPAAATAASNRPAASSATTEHRVRRRVLGHVPDRGLRQRHRREGGEECDDWRRERRCSARAAPPPASWSACGNGRVDPGEACDDGNPNECDGCDSDLPRRRRRLPDLHPRQHRALRPVQPTPSTATRCAPAAAPPAWRASARRSRRPAATMATRCTTDACDPARGCVSAPDRVQRHHRLRRHATLRPGDRSVRQRRGARLRRRRRVHRRRVQRDAPAASCSNQLRPGLRRRDLPPERAAAADRLAPRSRTPPARSCASRPTAIAKKLPPRRARARRRRRRRSR